MRRNCKWDLAEAVVYDKLVDRAHVNQTGIEKSMPEQIVGIEKTMSEQIVRLSVYLSNLNTIGTCCDSSTLPMLMVRSFGIRDCGRASRVAG
jgi:hypothetical protein